MYEIKKKHSKTLITLGAILSTLMHLELLEIINSEKVAEVHWQVIFLLHKIFHSCSLYQYLIFNQVHA